MVKLYFLKLYDNNSNFGRVYGLLIASNPNCAL